MTFMITLEEGEGPELAGEAVYRHGFPGVRAGALRLDEEGFVTRGFAWIDEKVFTVESDSKNKYKVRYWIHKDTVLKDWGFIDAPDFVDMFIGTNARDEKASEFIYRTVKDLTGLDDYLLTVRLLCFKPFRSEKFEGKLSISKNFEKLKVGVETAMKGGKARKGMFPELEGNLLDRAVDMWNKRFVKRDVKVFVSEKGEDFAKAYSHSQMNTTNLETTFGRKGLQHSCMRYKFENLPIHPCSVYGSGDFKIYWTENSQGLIGSRCVVYFPTKEHYDGVPQAAPIYGVCEYTIDVLENRLKDDGVQLLDTSWVGARLLKVPYEEGGIDAYIGPFFDVSPQYLREEEKYLVADRSGEIELGSYNGIINGYDCVCESCGDGLHEDHRFYSEHHDANYCEYCYNERVQWCEWTETDYPIEDIIEVHTSNGIAYVWQDHDDVVLAADGNHWDINDCTYCEYDSMFIPCHKLEELGYFMSDWDEEIYPQGQLCMLCDGKCVSKDEVDNSDEYEYDEKENVYKFKEEE